MVIDYYQDLVQLLHLQLLGRLGDLALLLDDAPQRRLVPHVPVGLLALTVELDVLLDGDPAVVYVDGRAEDVDFLKDAATLLQNHADQRHGLARFGRPEEDAGARNQGRHGVRGLLASVLGRGEELDLPHSSFCVTSQIRSREAGRERCDIYSVAARVFWDKTKGMRLKHIFSKSWLAPRLDLLLGDILVLRSPFLGSGKPTLPGGARAWRCVASTPSSPSRTCTAAT